MTRTETRFNAAKDGFAFGNRFEIPLFDRIQAMMPLHSTKINRAYGLCGGMCFAALDHFYANKKLPGYEKVESIDLKYFFYLWDRQVDSMSGDVLPKLVKWMLWGDRTLSLRVANEEAPRLRSMLRVGELAPLVLVRVRFGDPTQNHQVLATGFDEDADSQDMTIFLYDPNHPKSRPELRLNLAKPGLGINIRQSTGEPLRGFFVIDYARQDPPL